jgi:hypothetical protein
MHLFSHVAEIADEKAWKCDPIVSDSPTDTSIKFPHPSASSKELETKRESFSNICIRLLKPDAPQLGLEFSYDNKKAVLRFSDMLQDWNKNICGEFLVMIQNLDEFSFKLQVKTTYVKKSLGTKQEDVFVAPAASVRLNDIVENFKKVTDLCMSTEMVDDDKAVKSRAPGILICREYSLADLEQENSSFDADIKAIHSFMLLEPKILSEKDVKKSVKVQKKVGEDDKFFTILSNRADEQFYCRLTNAEFQRKPEHFGVQVWNKDTLVEKKYIRAALKLIKEI